MLGDEEEVSQRVVERVSGSRSTERFEADSTISYAPGSVLTVLGPDGKRLAFLVQSDGSLKQVPYQGQRVVVVIPEPSRVGLMLLGAMALVLRRRRGTRFGMS